MKTDPLIRVSRATIASQGDRSGAIRRKWRLVLACGHTEYRYARIGTRHPPKRAKCFACGTIWRRHKRIMSGLIAKLLKRQKVK